LDHSDRFVDPIEEKDLLGFISKGRHQAIPRTLHAEQDWVADKRKRALRTPVASYSPSIHFVL